MNQITIADKPIAVKTWHGQRVVTFKDIDTVHSRPDGTASRNFRTNRKHFIEGEDWHKIKPDEIRRVGITSPNGGIVLTETGYLMLVKSFTDDLAWRVQRELVKNYFRGENIPEEGVQLALPEKPYEYFDKTWNGEPVLTTEDFMHLTGMHRSWVSWQFRKHDFSAGVDFYLLNGKDSAKFRLENPRMPRNSSHFYLITASGFRKLCKYAGLEVEEPKCYQIEVKQTAPVTPSRISSTTAAEVDELIDTLAVLKKTRHEAIQMKCSDVVIGSLERSMRHIGMVVSAYCR